VCGQPSSFEEAEAEAVEPPKGRPGEGRDKEGTPVRDEGSISYSAAIESAAQKDTDEVPSEFAARVEREARRRG
jgi:hypothetical protein